MTQEIREAHHQLKIDLAWFDSIEFEGEKTGAYPTRINDIIKSSRKLFNALSSPTPEPGKEYTREHMMDFGLFCCDYAIERIGGNRKITSTPQLLTEYLNLKK